MAAVKNTDEVAVCTAYIAGRPVGSIAQEHGIVWRSVYTILRKHNVPLRGRPRKEQRPLAGEAPLILMRKQTEAYVARILETEPGGRWR